MNKQKKKNEIVEGCLGKIYSSYEDVKKILNGEEPEGQEIPRLPKYKSKLQRNVAFKFWRPPLNWRVIPAKAGTHEPAIPSWTDYREKKVTANDIIKWFPDDYEGNIEVITGKPSGIVVLDIDEKGGKSGSAELTARGLYDKIPATLACETANDGRHYYFRYPEGLDFPLSIKDIGIPGVEVFGDGWKAELPLSTLTLDDGFTGIYIWELQTLIDKIETDEIYKLIEPMPQWLIDLCREAYQKRLDGKNVRIQSEGFDSLERQPTDKDIAWAKAALKRESDELAKVKTGSRNDALNVAANPSQGRRCGTRAV